MISCTRLRSRVPLWTAFMLFLPAILPSALTGPIIASACTTDTIYVNNVAGSNANDGCSPQAPKSTFGDPTGALATLQGRAGKVIALMGTGTPYRERLRLQATDSGSPGQPFTLLARGNVIIEGSTPLNWTSCNPYTGAYHASVSITGQLDETVVSVDTVLYTYDNSGAPYCSVSVQQYKYDPTAQVLYISTPGGPSPNTYVSVRDYGIRVEASHVVVDGFIVNHAASAGIRVQGANTSNRTQSVTIKNCTSAYNKRHGILLQFTTKTSVLNNLAYNNVQHGVCLRGSDSCYVARNAAFRNDNPLECRGSVVGFKIGDGDSTTLNVANDMVTGTTVEYNSAYNNEDSGFEVHGAKDILLRRNLSYRNQDHGYDTQRANRVVYHNNVASRNDHDGLSVESDAFNVELYNSILSGNAAHPFTLQNPGGVRELVVYQPAGFEAGYNVIAGLSAATWSGSTVCTAASGTFYRTLVQYQSSKYDTFNDFSGAHPTLCDGSRNTYPGFVDSSAAVPDFRIASGDTIALDAAQTDRADWLDVDARGFEPFDGSAPNTGSGIVAYADIGVYEDVEPGVVADLDAPAPGGTHSIALVWTATSDDRAAGGPAEYLDIRYAQIPINAEAVWDTARQVTDEPQPDTPEAEQVFEVSGLAACTEYYFAVKVGDKNGNWSDRSNMVLDTTSCYTGGCVPAPCEIERPGQNRAMVVGQTDFPLSLVGPVPNPAHDAARVEWSIPQNLAGATYDLSLFDVAGRRVRALVSGTARPGRFTHEMSFLGEDGRALPTGVFFLRLRVGGEVRKKAVVLTH